MSDFWIGYGLGILTIFVLCFIAIVLKGSYLQTKSNKFMTAYIKHRNKKLQERASKLNKK